MNQSHYWYVERGGFVPFLFRTLSVLLSIGLGALISWVWTNDIPTLTACAYSGSGGLIVVILMYINDWRHRAR